MRRVWVEGVVFSCWLWSAAMAVKIYYHSILKPQRTLSAQRFFPFSAPLLLCGEFSMSQHNTSHALYLLPPILHLSRRPGNQMNMNLIICPLPDKLLVHYCRARLA